MFNVYIQYTSPKRGKQKPILFDKADTIEGAHDLMAKATSEQMERTDIFIGAFCTKCKTAFKPTTSSLGYCLGCIGNMAEEDREDPSGGAYDEHQWS